MSMGRSVADALNRWEVVTEIISFPWFPCIGVPGLITADMVKEGSAVIDVGINRIQDPKTGKLRLIGDVDFEGK